MQEPVACQLFIFCKDDVARCVPAGDNDARPDHLVNKCNLPPCLRGWVRSISTTKLVVNEQLKPVEIIDWSMIPCTHGQGTCTYGGVGCGHTPSIVPIRTPIIGARQTGNRTGYHHIRVCHASGCLATCHGSSADFYVILSQP